MEKIIIANGIESELAEYKEQVIRDYANNPFIEALPQLLTENEVIEKLAYYPPYSPSERQLDSQYRIHMINRLFQIFQPLPMAIELESKLGRAIRQGYISRNMFSTDLAKGFRDDYNRINHVNSKKFTLSQQMATSFSLIGISGLGKTSSLERILKLYPQVITHTNYRGINFSMHQVVFIKLECPFDGSVKGLLLEFFSTVDRLLGTNYFQKMLRTRPTTDIMISAMNQVVRNIGLGLLVIDEIQHLSLAKSGGSEKMLSFFVNLINCVGVQILLVGTPKAIGVLQLDFRMARRGVGQGGDMIYDRLKKDKVFELLVESIFGYNWLKKETSLTTQWIDVLYEETQGIPDLLKKVYAIAQVHAITTGKEEITPALIRKVSKEQLRLVQPMIQALKTGDMRKVAMFEDICIADVDFSGILSTASQSIDLDLRVKALRKKQDENTIGNVMKQKENAVLKLIDLGFDVKKIQKVIEDFVSEQKEIDVNALVIQALTFLTSDTFPKISTKSNKMKKTPILNITDIRYIVEQGNSNNQSAYVSLIEAGYIKRFSDDIFRVGVIV